MGAMSAQHFQDSNQHPPVCHSPQYVVSATAETRPFLFSGRLEDLYLGGGISTLHCSDLQMNAHATQPKLLYSMAPQHSPALGDSRAEGWRCQGRTISCKIWNAYDIKTYSSRLKSNNPITTKLKAVITIPSGRSGLTANDPLLVNEGRWGRIYFCCLTSAKTWAAICNEAIHINGSNMSRAEKNRS